MMEPTQADIDRARAFLGDTEEAQGLARLLATVREETIVLCEKEIVAAVSEVEGAAEAVRALRMLRGLDGTEEQVTPWAQTIHFVGGQP
jgi:hypothetical protein